MEEPVENINEELAGLNLDEIPLESLSEKGKQLKSENAKLKERLKELEVKFDNVQEECTKSKAMRDRLDGLCKELQKQTQDIKDENHALLKEAEERGKGIADHVASNVGDLDNINVAIGSVSKENAEARTLNDRLANEITGMKLEYDDREVKLRAEYEEANKELMQAKREIAMERLSGAQGKETIYGEMQEMANALVDCKRSLKDTKELEYNLRTQIESFDAKFNELSSSIVDTNSQYGHFNEDLEKITKEAKGLEEEARGWQKKWGETNKDLGDMTNRHTKCQNDLVDVHEKLIKMTNLYRALQDQKTELLKKLNKEDLAQKA